MGLSAVPSVCPEAAQLATPLFNPFALDVIGAGRVALPASGLALVEDRARHPYQTFDFGRGDGFGTYVFRSASNT